jgi:cell division protein FtsI/penicillin-binding protein 2
MNEKSVKRIYHIGIGVLILFALLIVRLGSVQLIDGMAYAEKAVKQRTVRIALYNSRGRILDRNGIPFTDRETTKKLIVFPVMIQDDSVYGYIYSVTGKKRDDIEKAADNRSYVVLDVSDNTTAVPQNAGGILLAEVPRRYGQDMLALHVIGYTDKSNRGVQGIEKSYDNLLRGTGSYSINAVVDAKRRMVPGIGYTVIDERRGAQDITLTLDYHIQKITEQAMDKNKNTGAAVVMDVHTGDILAMASRPTFDPYSIARADGDALLNKALLDVSPGSIFKIVVAAAALDTGKADLDTEFKCDGYVNIKGRRFGCDVHKDGAGFLDMRQAFAISCNSYFIQLAQLVGGDDIVRYAEAFGLGYAIDGIPDQQPGLLPTREEYAGPGIGNLALGQGKVEATPLQIATMVAAVANGGIKPAVSLVEGQGSDQSVRVVSSSTAYKLMTLMRDVTISGSGKRAYSDMVGGTAGKTGTPDIGPYAWFAGYFPAHAPEYAIAVLTYNDGYGGQMAAPIFKDIAEGIYKIYR